MECQAPKAILLPVGEMKFPYEWAPELMPTQMFEIGNLVIVGLPGEFTTMSGRRIRNDIRKIYALDWLLLDGDSPQYLELLWQANALIRNFLLEQKIDLACETYNKLPSNIVNESYQEWKSSNNFDCGFDIENVIREYLCHSSYFDASEAFKKW